MVLPLNFSSSGDELQVTLCLFPFSDELSREKMIRKTLAVHYSHTGKTAPGTDPDDAASWITHEMTEIIKGPHGKPYFKNLPLSLSVSHTKEVIAIAISPENIGIDLEGKRKANYSSIAGRFFHEDEKKLASGEDAFLEIWTAKEAYVKYTGRGICDDFSFFNVYALPEIIKSAKLPMGLHLSLCSSHDLPVNICCFL